MPPRRPWLGPALAVLTGVALVSPRALAQQAPPPPPITPKTATFNWDTPVLRASISFREIVDEAIVVKINSGIPTVVVLRAWVFQEQVEQPISLAPKSCTVVYDLWDEVYIVEITQPGGTTRSTAPNLAGVIRRCAQVDTFPLVERARLKPKTNYFVQGIVEVNPISADVMARIKKWVSRPQGSATVGAGDALFGSFVGLFVAQIGNADREFRFRTQNFVLPPPPPPPSASSARPPPPKPPPPKPP
jgi:hypothetical protein